MAGKDEFFAPDCTWAWYQKLPGPKAFYMFGKANHAGYHQGPEFKDAADAFINGILLEKPMPEINWTIEKTTGDITVRQVSNHTPTSVRLWSAYTTDGLKRDFRSA